jgi:hypothetical protein
VALSCLNLRIPCGNAGSRGFYVDDRDYRSKRFFNGVYDIFNMEIAPSGGGGGPIVTLPVK